MHLRMTASEASFSVLLSSCFHEGCVAVTPILRFGGFNATGAAMASMPNSVGTQHDRSDCIGNAADQVMA